MSWHLVWIPPGLSADVAGQTIPGGMLYIGQYLRSGVGTIEPSLINPVLPVDRAGRDHARRDLPPSPSYHLISAADRGEYLSWLATGRDHVPTPIGFIRLFFSGLERRVLLDRADDASVTGELPAITAEVHRLRQRYGPASRSFDAAASAFLQVLELLTTPARPLLLPSPPPSGPGPTRVEAPLALRVALAQFAICGQPVPAGWARWWAWHHPSLFPTTPQTRCPEEFNTLFALRYQARSGVGLIPGGADQLPIRLSYRPVNPGLDPAVTERPDLPDLLAEPSAGRELGAVIDSVTEALTPYSRWLARHPEGAGSTASGLLLPGDLLEHEPGPLRRLVSWSNARLGGRGTIVIDGREFSPFWATADPDRMSREESESLITVLSRIGLGVEPDVRFGGTALGTGPVVLFRLDPLSEPVVSPGYRLAVTVLDLAAWAILPTSTGRMEDVVNRTVTALATGVPLTIGERSRLSARLRWLIAIASSRSATEATRLRRKAADLSPMERETAGQLLLTVAAAVSDGSGGLASNAALRSLTAAYRVIGLPEELLFRQVHQHRVDGPDNDSPVIVRRARTETTGHRLPRTSARPPAAVGLNPETDPDAPIQLRRSVVNRTLAQSAAVSALLSDIFVDDEPVPMSGSAGPGLFAGPDQLPVTLMRQLATRSMWSRADFADLANQHGVLPERALDVINEQTIELTGEPAIEGDDELTVNHDVLREILGADSDAI